MSEETKKTEQAEQEAKAAELEASAAELPDKDLDEVAGGASSAGYIKSTSRVY